LTFEVFYCVVYCNSKGFLTIDVVMYMIMYKRFKI